MTNALTTNVLTPFSLLSDGDDEEEEEEEAEGQEKEEKKEDEEDEEDEEAAIILKEIQSRVDAAYAVTQEVRSLSDGEVDYPLYRIRVVLAREYLGACATTCFHPMLLFHGRCNEGLLETWTLFSRHLFLGTVLSALFS